ncbi:putative zinc finger protein 840 [Mercenaria mercenaria]|uniref:putative zinc finger protein 840 n=1 Tax=Mercenaria mercenaria TaxID=6596 RepID=UPI00234E569A|nr:putative zinc finger protein 840 [Mercenaria mercenaria]XP_053401580.1 putative zinc finger protein 840 [Mercenaria mercenaria]XP_053401581.1 putative zinc finger protein 840 [Mercenaria mercenaria]
MASRNTKIHQTKQSSSRNAVSASTKKAHDQKDTRHIPSKAATLQTAIPRKYPCNSCAKSFSTPAELSQHKNDKHGIKPLKSMKCTALPPGANKLCSGKFSCTSCARTFSANNELVQHQRDKHQIIRPSSSHSNLVPATVNKSGAVKVSCSFCDRKFSTNPELSQHQRDKHKIDQTRVSHSAISFPGASNARNGVNCRFCSRSFVTDNELHQHQRDKHQIDEFKVRPATVVPCHENKPHIGTLRCSLCDKHFLKQNELFQHQKDKHSTSNHSATLLVTANNSGKGGSANFPARPSKPVAEHDNTCSICSSHFSSASALLQHRKDRHQARQDGSLSHSISEKKKSCNDEYKCQKCTKSFSTKSQLDQHQHDKHQNNGQVQHTPQAKNHGHNSAKGNAKQDGLTKQEKAELLRNERKKEIDEYYAKKVDIDKDEKKASVRIVNETLSKIMSHVHGQRGGDIYCPNHVKAGSFPVNTKIGKPDEFDTNICVKLGHQDVKISSDRKINYAYAQTEHATNMNVKCELGQTKRSVKVPDSYAVASVDGDKIPGDLRHGRDLIPREMRYDLYQKIKTAINELNLKYVDLSRDAHGPAITMTIRPRKQFTIQHHISVDITISLPSDKPIMKWPRKETKKAFSEKLINDVKETGTHLVPKKDEFWAISYSRAERALFSRIDEGNGCRKFVYKMLKKYMQSCKSCSKNGLPGLSSHILKTQLLWSCERRTAPEYWHHNNRDMCLIDALADLEKTLKSGHLPDYFDTKVDILKGKDAAACNELANYLHVKKTELERE